MKELGLIILALMLLPVVMILVCVAYISAIHLVQGAHLNLGARRARRLVKRRGSVAALSDQELVLAQKLIAARMALQPFRRQPSWLKWCYDLQQQLDLHSLSREAWALNYKPELNGWRAQR